MSQDESSSEKQSEYSHDNLNIQTSQSSSNSSESNQSNDSESSIQKKIQIMSQTKQQTINYKWNLLFNRQQPQNQEDQQIFDQVQEKYKYIMERCINLQQFDSPTEQLLSTLVSCDKCGNIMWIPFTSKENNQQYQKLCLFCMQELQLEQQFQYCQFIFQLDRLIVLYDQMQENDVQELDEEQKCDKCQEKVIISQKIEEQKNCIFCNRVFCEKCMQTGIIQKIKDLNIDEVIKVINYIPDQCISYLNQTEIQILLQKYNRQELFQQFINQISKLAYTPIQTYKPIYLDKDQYCCKYCYSLLFDLACKFIRQTIIDDTRPKCLLGCNCAQQWSNKEHQQKFQHYGKGIRDLII